MPNDPQLNIGLITTVGARWPLRQRQRENDADHTCGQRHAVAYPPGHPDQHDQCKQEIDPDESKRRL